MKVGIDISALVYERGVSRYTANLVRALATQQNVSLALYGVSWRQQHKLKMQSQMLIKGARRPAQVSIQSWPPSLQKLAWQKLKLNPVKHHFPDLDVFHSWDWLQPPDKKLPLVSTIHDLAMLRFPETAHPSLLAAHQHSWKILKQRGAQLIAVSHATRNDILELLDFPAENVHVVHEALPLETQHTARDLPEEQYENIKEKLSLTKPFVFFVGTREPRKNLITLIEAWEPLHNEVELIIAGEEAWDDSHKNKALKKIPSLRFLGRVSDQELSVLYSEAAVFAYPSLYEGFGLPILEAFSYGTPVVTSNLSSMPEVAGNAAELVDPKSPKEIREAIEKILNESSSAQQKRLQKMMIRLHLFDWQKVATETIKVYQRAINDV